MTRFNDEEKTALRDSYRSIPYGKQSISAQDIQAVVNVLQSDFITQGPVIEQFENVVAQFCGAKHAIAVSNATAALHLSCQALNIRPGDQVWTSPVSFVASSNCALYCGATIDFVDIDPKTYNMSVVALRQKLKAAKSKAELPKAVIPVHLAGQSCEMDAIYALAMAYGFQVIEDASHAIGGQYQGKPVGSCTYSSMTVFSFHPVKVMTTGEGGMVLTNSDELATTVKQLRTHGITRDTLHLKNANGSNSPPPWYYEQQKLGFNYRMTDLQAALGVSQLERLPSFIKRRHELVMRYHNGLKDLPLLQPWQHPDSYSAFHLYIIRLQLNQLTIAHRQVFEKLRDRGIGVNLHYIPIYRQPYYQEQFDLLPTDYPEAEQYYKEAISLPLYVDLTEADQNYVIETLHAILATKAV